MKSALILVLLGGLMVPQVVFGITITFNDGVHGQPESYANNIVTITSLTPNSAIFGKHVILDLVEQGSLILENSAECCSPYLFSFSEPVNVIAVDEFLMLGENYFDFDNGQRIYLTNKNPYTNRVTKALNVQNVQSFLWYVFQTPSNQEGNGHIDNLVVELPHTVPEPSTILLVLTGLGGLWWWKTKKSD